MNVSIYKKVNMFTTAGGADIPVLEWINGRLTIPTAADHIKSLHPQGEVPKDTYFLIEEHES